MPYSAYCLLFVPPNKRLDPVLCSIGKWLICAPPPLTEILATLSMWDEDATANKLVELNECRRKPIVYSPSYENNTVYKDQD